MPSASCGTSLTLRRQSTWPRRLRIRIAFVFGILLKVRVYHDMCSAMLVWYALMLTLSQRLNTLSTPIWTAALPNDGRIQSTVPATRPSSKATGKTTTAGVLTSVSARKQISTTSAAIVPAGEACRAGFHCRIPAREKALFVCCPA